jgi:hypothetical protein
MLYSSALQVICTYISNLPNVQYYHRLYTGYSKRWNKVRAAIDFALTKSFLWYEAAIETLLEQIGCSSWDMLNNRRKNLSWPLAT